MRERIEDLGIIAEKMSVILEKNLFKADLSQECADDPYYQDEIRNEIESLREELNEIYEIARWGDDEWFESQTLCRE